MSLIFKILVVLTLFSFKMLGGDSNLYGGNFVEADEIEENLKRHIIALSVDLGERNFIRYENLEKAANYIKQGFKNYGYSPEEQVYHLEGRPFRNIIATKMGGALPKRVIIICAHYDSVIGSPGADDNASGVAGLLELASLLSKDNPNKTIKFIAFTNEEPPFFIGKDMGSLRYVTEAKKKGEDIEVVLCLESIGYYSEEKKSQGCPLGLSLFYPDKGNFIGLVSNLASYPFLKRIAKEFKKNSNFPLECLVAPIFLAPAISFSDHWSFWRFGYKAVMITDTAFYRNPHYHSLSDTAEKLNYEYMAKVVGGLYRVLLDLAK